MEYEIRADAWYPVHATPPLVATPEGLPVHSDGYELLKVIDKVWPMTLDYWQRRLIIHALEVYPDTGKLRFQQVVISLPRQNGKSEIAAAFGLYGLLKKFNGKVDVVSLATKVETANIVYGRVRQVIKDSAALSKRYKPTGTRGIVHRENTSWTYKVYPGTEDKLNGIPMTVCIYDELHLIDPSAYNQAVLGTSGVGGITIGITTAGDDNSELLKSLYEQGKAEDNERLGFFLWEAPARSRTDDPQALIAANPAIACGRLDVAEQLNLIRGMPEYQARRYRLNQFVSTSDGWLPADLWLGLPVGTEPFPKGTIYAVARAGNNAYATILAAFRHGDAIHVKVVASLVRPSLDDLEAHCLHLNKTRPAMFVMDGSLKELKERLVKRGIKHARYNTVAEMQVVCATAYREIADGKIIRSAGDLLLDIQVPRGVAINVGDGWRISPQKSVGDIDALIALVMAIHGAATHKERRPTMHVST